MEKLQGWLWQDLRFAVRSLNKDRRFTLLAVLALALGIGSVTVIFSAVYGVVLDTFPYAHYDRMVSFSIDPIGQASGNGREMLSIPEFLDFREQNHVFVEMAGGTSVPALHSAARRPNHAVDRYHGERQRLSVPGREHCCLGG